MLLKVIDNLLLAILLVLSNLLVLSVKVHILRIVFAGDDLVPTADHLCLLVAVQVLLCLEVQELLLKLSLERLRNNLTVEGNDLVHEQMIQPFRAFLKRNLLQIAGTLSKVLNLGLQIAKQVDQDGALTHTGSHTAAFC